MFSLSYNIYYSQTNLSYNWFHILLIPFLRGGGENKSPPALYALFQIIPTWNKIYIFFLFAMHEEDQFHVYILHINENFTEKNNLIWNDENLNAPINL